MLYCLTILCLVFLADDDDDEKPTLPGPVVPASYTPAIAAVLSAFEAPGVKVRDLVALVPHK